METTQALFKLYYCNLLLDIPMYVKMYVACHSLHVFVDYSNITFVSQIGMFQKKQQLFHLGFKKSADDKFYWYGAYGETVSFHEKWSKGQPAGPDGCGNFIVSDIRKGFSHAFGLDD